jgi:hypothetical protein
LFSEVIMAFSTIREIVERLDWPDALKQDAIAFFEELPQPLKAGVLGTSVALMWAGLKTGLVQNDSQNSPAALERRSTEVRPYDQFRLTAMSLAIRTELKLWKSFHAIDAEMKLYCAQIAKHATSTGNRKIDDIRSAILSDFRPLLTRVESSRFPDFYTLAQGLRRAGYLPLLASIEGFLNLRLFPESGTHRAELLKRLKELNYGSPLDWIRDCEDLCDLVRRQSELLSECITDEHGNGPLLRGFVEERHRATHAALRFCTAIFMAERYLALNSAATAIEDSAYRYRSQILTWLATELPEGMTQRVVNFSNDVIFRWIDVLAMTKDPSAES